MGAGQSTESAEQRKRRMLVDSKMEDEASNLFEETMTFLAQVALLKRLPRDQHPVVAEACVRQDFGQGRVVIQQGEPGSEFFVIRQGQAAVQIEKPGSPPTKVATLKAGDYFGENALLRDEPRAATIVAETKLLTLKLTREKFQELGLHKKLRFANRKAVGAGDVGKTLSTDARPPSPKTDEEVELIADALRNNKNLNTVVDLNEERIKQIVDIAWMEPIRNGTEVIKQGDSKADHFYVVQEGSFKIILDKHHEQPAPTVSGGAAASSQDPLTISAGGSFGELSLLYHAPRAATIKALSTSIVWVVDRTSFKKILIQTSEQKIDQYVTYLDQVDILSSLLGEEKRAVAASLEERHFTNDEYIFNQGERGDTFFILVEGDVSITKDGKVLTTLQADAARGTIKFFGERALLNNEPRAATVTVTSQVAKALSLDRESFTLLLGPLQDIIDEAKESGQSDGRRASVNGRGNTRVSLTMTGAVTAAPRPDDKREKIFKRDLKRVGVLGFGGFGAVELWEHREVGSVYAMKGLSKGHILEDGLQEAVMKEKNIMLMVNSPFIIRLFETYNGSQTLYFLLEAALGGDLLEIYNREGLHGSVPHTRYYVAGVVFAIDHCHQRKIIYRDLKPENLLLGKRGHVKLADMGLAKFVIGKTYTTCGTPDYFAPEVIAGSGHARAVDWWATGILMFELLAGQTPFESEQTMQTYAKIMKGITKVPFPLDMQGAPENFVKAMLTQEPSQRMPMRSGGVKNIKKDRWYKGFDWQGMEEATLEPPFRPDPPSKEEVRKRPVMQEEIPPHSRYTDDGTGWDIEFASC